MKKSKHIAWRILINLDYFIAGAALIALVLVTAIGVVARYALNAPFVWQEEVQIWCFLWIVFFGTGAAFRTNSHVAIDVLVDRFSPTGKKVVNIFVYIVVMFILMFMAKHGADLVFQMVKNGRHTPVLGIPAQVIYSAFPIGCVLMIINYSAIILSPLFEKRRPVGGDL